MENSLGTNLYGLTKDEFVGLIDIGTVTSIVKGSDILSVNGYDDSLYIINKGVLRGYMLSDGENLTAWFAVAGELAVSMWCYNSGKRSPIGIEAATDVEAVRITKEAFEKWCSETVENAVVGRKLFVEYVAAQEEKLIEYFQCDTAEKRYMLIMKKYPAIYREVPLKQLASYLWVTPQSLSRIRRNVK